MSRWLSPGVHFKDDPQVRVCARCGYPFPGGQHGAPAACSECGTYIDPTKAGLLRSLAPAMMLQRALRAPGLWSMGLIALCACALAIAQAVPGGYALWSIAAIAGIVVMMLIVGMRLLVALVVARKLRRVRDMLRQRGWWAVPCFAIIATVLAASPLPIHVLFRLERPRLDAAAAAWLAQGGAATSAVQLDFLLIPGASQLDPSLVEPLSELATYGVQPASLVGGFGFAVPGTGFIFERGVYYYLPNLLPGSVPNHVLRHLGGPWYSGRFDE